MEKDFTLHERRTSGGFRFDYYLFPDSDLVDGRLTECLSLRVVLTGSGVLKDATARDVAADRRSAEKIFRSVSDGLVSPENLFDVLEEII